MGFLRLLPVLVLLAALPAAAGTVEDRASALSRAEAQEAELGQRIARLSAELEQVAGRIESLKAHDRQSGAVLPDQELTDLLGRSQELAEVLSALGRDRDHAEASRRDAAAALVDACELELDRLRDAVTSKDRAAIERFTTLDQLRDHARAYLSRSLSRVPTSGDRHSDDPAELRERADLLRDQQDRVRERIHELDDRISELRDRARLDRAMRSMLREQDLFDDASRMQRVRIPTQAGRSATSAGDSDRAVPAAAGDEAPASFGSSPGGGESSRTTDGSGATATPATPVPVAPATAPGFSAIPRFGGDPRTGAGFLAPLSGRESLDDLETARTALQRESTELERSATDLEHRARKLEQPE